MRLIFLVISAFLLLSACSSNEEAVKEKGVEKTKEKVETKIDDYPEASNDPEQIVMQPVGVETKNALSIMDKQDESAWDKVLADFQMEEMNQAEIFNGLIYHFGMDYKDTHSALANFEPDYGEYDIATKKETYKNISIQIDSSGSMAASVPGGVKMDLAKNAVKNYASGLPGDSMISLRVYGHQGTGKDSDKNLSCTSTEVMYEPKAYDETAFTTALN